MVEEVLLGLYNFGGSMQIQEIDECMGEGYYFYEWYYFGGQYGIMLFDSFYN